MTEQIGYDLTDGIAMVNLDAPKTRNALSSSLLAGIGWACERAVQDGARALLLTSSGRTFSAGGDLAGVDAAFQGDPDTEIAVLVDELHAVIRRIRTLPMPTVAAIDGAAVGAGISLAMTCDVRVVSTSAVFVTGYLAVGASPDGGASHALATALGPSYALSSFLLSRRLDAPELLARGLADQVVAPEELHSAACQMAARLAALSVPALLATRALVQGAASRSVSDHLDIEKKHFMTVVRTPVFRENVAAYGRRLRTTVTD